MKFLLFNKNEELIATLKDVISAKQPEELNGEDVLEIETLTKVEKKQRIVYKDHLGYWKEYEITGVEEIREGEGVIYQIFAESSFYETIGDYIEDKRCYNYPANSALEVALQPTRWEVGIVDDLGIESTNFYHISSKEAVSKVVETWKGELRTRITIAGNKITHRYIDVLQNRGNDYGKRFTYTKDLLSIRKTVHRDDVITALYGYGKGEEIYDDEGTATGGYGRRIDFKNINGGKGYVENNDARLIWGRNNPDGSKSHVFGKVEFDDCEDKTELLALTIDKLDVLSKPFVTYTATVIDLKAFGFEHEGVSLGDFAKVIDKEFKPVLRLRSKIIKIVWDLIEPENTEITLGNFIPSSIDRDLEIDDFISNFRDKQGIWDRSDLLDKDGLNAQYLKGIIEELNTQMNSQGGYVYISEDGKGLTTYDKPIDQNPTKAIQIVGGAFRIANTKNPDGSFNYRSFGTGDGFVADGIIAGTLKGGKVKFNLTNGTLLIGEDTEDYKLWFDGTDLNINAIVRIGASTVFDEGYSPNDLKDYIDDVVGDLGDLDLGDLAYEDIVEKAMLGETILSGGYIKTELIQIGNATSFAEGYSPSDILGDANDYTDGIVSDLEDYADGVAGGALVDARDDIALRLGYTNYNNMVSAAISSGTIISGGYINTNLISFNNAIGTNVNLSGTIYATLGKIGGFTISGTDLVGYVSGIERIRLSPNMIKFTDEYSRGVAYINVTNNKLILDKSGNGYIGLTLDSTHGSEIVRLSNWGQYNDCDMLLYNGNITLTATTVTTSSNFTAQGVMRGYSNLILNGSLRVLSSSSLEGGLSVIGSISSTTNISATNNISLGGTISASSTLNIQNASGNINVASDNNIHLNPSANVYVDKGLRPRTTGDANLGSTSYRWGYVYLNNQPNVSSDVREKSLIQEIPKELIEELSYIKPKMYTQNDMWHFGYIAQDVETVLFKYAVKKAGFGSAKDYMKEFAVLHKDESYLSLLYGEIAVLKEQQTLDKISDLENRLLVLEGR